MTEPQDPQHESPLQTTTRRFRRRGVDVEIRESKRQLEATDLARPAAIELTLDGIPVAVSIVDDKYQSQLANQFTEFETIDDVVDALLATEGRTWTLHGAGGGSARQHHGRPGEGASGQGRADHGHEGPGNRQ
jgi:hypothetical protein